MQLPKDKTGVPVHVGATVRILSLSGQWLENLPEDEKSDVLSMVGHVFQIEEIDEYGQPWVSKSWPDPENGRYHCHSVALESYEIELVIE